MKRLLTCVFIIFVCLIPAGPGETGGQRGGVTAILGAFDAEVELITAAMTDRTEKKFLDITFVVGVLEGRRVVVAKAGIGKVNAAMTTTLLVEHFNPNEVIFTGIAGGINPDLHPGDIVIGLKTAQHDYCLLTDEGPQSQGTKNPTSAERNPVFFPADDKLLDIARAASARVELSDVPAGNGNRTPRIMEGVIVTGDAFIASDNKRIDLRERFEADAVEMEGAAVAQVCYYLKVPCLVIRSISDRADSSARIDIERFYRVAANNSASLVMVAAGLLAENDK